MGLILLAINVWKAPWNSGVHGALLAEAMTVVFDAFSSEHSWIGQHKENLAFDMDLPADTPMAEVLEQAKLMNISVFEEGQNVRGIKQVL